MITNINKIRGLIDRDQKRKIPLVLLLMAIGAIMETLSVSMLVPMISIIMDTESVQKNKVYLMADSLFHMDDPHFFVQILFFVIAGIFICKNLFLYVQISYQSRYASDVRQRIQNKLYEDCIHKPYEFYLGTNTGDILRNIYVDSMGVYNSLLSIMSVLMEGVVSIALVITVLIINPFISLVCIGIIAVIAIIIYVCIKPKMQRIGRTYSELSGNINQWILQSTDNVKEIKVMQRENFFVNEFRRQSRIYNDASCKNQVISNIPRLLIEAGTISGIIVMLGISYAGGAELNGIIPQLSAFAVAAVRLLPSINRLNTALNAVLFNEASVDHVIEALSYIGRNPGNSEIQSVDAGIIELSRLHKGIFIRNVSYSYPDADRNVFTDISLDIKKGETIGLIGESGAGKTTFVNLVLGLLNSAKGDVLWDDTKINGRNQMYHLNIGYIPQQISLLDDTIGANIVFGAEKIDQEQIERAIKQSQLEEFVLSLPKGINTEVGDRGVRLSGGQRQRIGIARALYMNPDFIVLDEATSALDNKTEAELMKSINSLRGDKTMIIIAHRLSTLDSCDRIYKLDNGVLRLERQSI